MGTDDNLAAGRPGAAPGPEPGPEPGGDLGHLDHLDGIPSLSAPDRFAEHRRAIEAVLMVADSPVEPGLLAQLLEIAPSQVDSLCQQLAESYRRQQRGFLLARVAGGYRFQSHPDLAPYIERFVLEGQSARLSAAALETLAIVAYKQPISRAQVAAIRGVNADAVLRTFAIAVTSARWPVTPALARPCCTGRARCCWNGWAWTR